MDRLIKKELFFSFFDPNWLDGDKRRDKLKTVNFLNLSHRLVGSF